LKAVKLNPDLGEAYSNMGNCLKDQSRVTEAITAYRMALECHTPKKSQIHSNLIFTIHLDPASTPETIHRELLQWNHLYASPLKKFIRSHTNNRDPLRRLKIGYIPPDLRGHSADFLDPLLSNHDHSQFEIFCYAAIANPDIVTERFRNYSDHWHNVVGMTDEKLIEQIRQDQIDVLVDLKLHAADNRLLVLARKPAPIQVTWAGYPSSTGLDSVDYRFSDPYLDPPETDLSVYSEQTIRLPETWWCYIPQPKEPYNLDLPRMKNGFITFGCLNNFSKINDGVWQLWAKVLVAVPDSQLIVLTPQGEARQELIEKLKKTGIDSRRVMFMDYMPRKQYLESFGRIDISLDPFPYNGHITSLDSLYMGVPVITLVGKTAVGRGGVSILTNVGLPELIAQTPEEYVDIATKLAGDLPRLTELRKTLRDRMKNSPLMDAKRFAHNIEAAYRKMWRKWCTQTQP
ncbi:MAG TPA: hypothetical protein VMG59_00465, partial [Phycisphaerae bacterium]|nr:hypothetical protein [Phycisphaerae bacterium]